MKKVMIIAAAAAICCGLLLYRYLSSVEERTRKAEENSARISRETRAPEEKIKLLTAKEDIPPYTPITADMVQLKDYPKAYAPAGAASTVEEVLGMQSAGTVYAGQILLKEAVGTPEEIGEGLAFRIPEGKRAMTLTLDTAGGVAGFLCEGDFVDLLYYLAAEPETEKPEEDTDGEGPVPDTEKPELLILENGEERVLSYGVAMTLLENAQVLELELPTYEPEESGYRYEYVTLALSPEECLKLLTAQMQGGRLTAVLRQRGDESLLREGPRSVTEIMGQ